MFASLAEEFGFVGCVVDPGALCGGDLHVACASPRSRTATSAGSAPPASPRRFALYVLINGAMVMGLAPVVGVPMPLLSFGGTVMMTMMVGFGLIMAVRVHRYAEISSGKGSVL